MSLALAPGPARPDENAEERRLAWRVSLKAGALVSRSPEDEVLFPERDSAASFWRLRLEPEARLGARVIAAGAYEHRLRVFSTPAAAAGFGVLPRDAPAPYRLRQLDWRIADSPGSSWRHEIDRASLAADLGRLKLTLGRQAVGWGRGVFFGAVDLFSPFSPIEADREWRRGVDAVRADVAITDRASVDLVGAFGERFDESVVAARLRGYAGKADVEVVGGRRGRDLFAGVTSSAAVGDAEVHGELALFRAPAILPGSGGRTALKAVAGASYRFDVADGLLVHAEYHYSGFGAKDPGGIAALLANRDFRARYLRGDTQILARHAAALLASYEVSPELALALQWLHGPADGSGLVAPSATVTLGDKLSLVGTGYLPYGPSPRGGTLTSEYGAAPRSALVQVRIHE